jgi:hypothetical protein
MEGWRQRRLGSKEDHSTTKGNYKIDLTLTGLLMEGLGSANARKSRAISWRWFFDKFDRLGVSLSLRRATHHCGIITGAALSMTL